MLYSILRFMLVMTIAFATANACFAELTVGGLAGIANFTTRSRGDAIFNFNGVGSSGYFQYPADYNSTDPALGIFVRYLYPFNRCVSFGAETGYTYIHVDHTHLKSDVVIGTSPVTVEHFTNKSYGLITLNAVLGLMLQNNFTLNLFVGPAWLNTKYIDNDFFDRFKVTTSNAFQITADAGMEADWYFMPNWIAGMRFDYIFDTKNRTVSRAGSTTAIDGIPLLKPATARSGLTLFSLTLRYAIPCI